MNIPGRSLHHFRRAAKALRTIPSFGAFADDYIKSHCPKFRNEKHAAQWEMTLGDAYCRAIRSLPVNAIDTEAVLKVLRLRAECGLKVSWSSTCVATTRYAWSKFENTVSFRSSSRIFPFGGGPYHLPSPAFP